MRAIGTFPSSSSSVHFHCLFCFPPGWGNFHGFVCSRHRQALDFGARNRKSAVSRVFLRVGRPWGQAVRQRNSWRHPAECLPDIPSPRGGSTWRCRRTARSATRILSFDPTLDCRLDPYTCPAGRLVFHARGNCVRRSISVIPRRFHQRHHRLPKLGNSSAHARSIGKKLN